MWEAVIVVVRGNLKHKGQSKIKCEYTLYRNAHGKVRQEDCVRPAWLYSQTLPLKSGGEKQIKSKVNRRKEVRI